MTDISKSPEKRHRKKQLFQIGEQTLETQGWTVTREKLGMSSVRRISKNGDSKLVSIRTTQDTWLAFPPKPNGKGWYTLDEVDVVLAVSVDPDSKREAWVHWLPADEMRTRYDLAYKARHEAGRVFRNRRGVWIPLYERESDNPDNVGYVGGGAGRDHEPINRVPLSRWAAQTRTAESEGVNGQLTIADAKRRLAFSLGVPESGIRITVEA